MTLRQKYFIFNPKLMLKTCRPRNKISSMSQIQNVIYQKLDIQMHSKSADIMVIKSSISLHQETNLYPKKKNIWPKNFAQISRPSEKQNMIMSQIKMSYVKN